MDTTVAELRAPARLYIALLAAAALGSSAAALSQADVPGARPQLALPLAIMVAIAVLFPLRTAPGTHLSLDTSMLFVTTLLFEPGAAMIIAALGWTLARAVRRGEWDEAVFNGSQTVLRVGAAGVVLAAVGWDFGRPALDSSQRALGVLLAAAAMYAVNTLFVAGMVALQTDQPLQAAWRRVARFGGPEVAAQFVLGLIAAVAIEDHAWVLPLLLAPAYVVYRSSARQVQLYEQALRDPLTGLPNRALLMDRLHRALDSTGRGGDSVAVLFLDLDRFKFVNDSLGHEAGDRVLVEVARRLRKPLRSGDTAARLGGDEFVILVERLSDASDAVRVAERIADAFRTPFAVGGPEVYLSASIGIAVAGDGARSPEELLREADAAMYRVKGTGKAGSAITSLTHIGREAGTNSSRSN